jgi:hypothetical protein
MGGGTCLRRRSADFAKKMSEMRVWLDRHSFEPARFTYQHDREIIVISVDFKWFRR